LYGLIGPGASGKSVLLKHIVGLMKPDRGQILVDGTDITHMSELELQQFRTRFGIAFQNNALFDHLSVGDNIAFPLRRLFKNLSEQEIQARVADRLKVVSLPGFEDRSPPSLSGGQKKRVAVARATVATTGTVLIYDEPAAGLDPVTSQKIFDLLKQEQGSATVVMVSSDLDRMLTVTDRVGMMLNGRLIFDGTTQEAKDSKNPYVHQFVHGLTEGPL
jgi:phospholipid/cholesterol/gamma-HCH transport system ATP-binding protein